MFVDTNWMFVAKILLDQTKYFLQGVIFCPSLNMCFILNCIDIFKLGYFSPGQQGYSFSSLLYSFPVISYYNHIEIQNK